MREIRLHDLLEIHYDVLAFPIQEVQIDEFVGNASNGDPAVSIARVVSKGKWAEDWQTPEFDE